MLPRRRETGKTRGKLRCRESRQRRPVLIQREKTGGVIHQVSTRAAFRQRLFRVGCAEGGRCSRTPGTRRMIGPVSRDLESLRRQIPVWGTGTAPLRSFRERDQRQRVLGRVSKVDFEVSLNHCQFQHGHEIDGRFFKSGSDSPCMFQPANATFHDVSPTIRV